MGAWGEYPLECDFGCEYWLYLSQEKTLAADRVAAIAETLDEALGSDYLEDDEGTAVVVASMLLVALGDREWFSGYPHVDQASRSAIDAWLDEVEPAWNSHQRPLLYKKALTAMDRVTSPQCETFELWEGNTTWLDNCNQIKGHLKQLARCEGA
ncbi:hypothetical protein DICA4_E01904 [Diutina catenulata]